MSSVTLYDILSSYYTVIVECNELTDMYCFFHLYLGPQHYYGHPSFPHWNVPMTLAKHDPIADVVNTILQVQVAENIMPCILTSVQLSVLNLNRGTS